LHGDRKELARYLALSQVGLEIVVPPVLGLLVDHWLKCFPWGVVIGAVLGFSGGLVHLVKLSNQQQQQQEREANKEDRSERS
jgi:F0F1-type ATP synthase assembly protein I